jgi:AcrR family transcriptional regulator
MVIRQRTSSAQIEDRVISAALALLEDEGVDALTVREIARRAEVAPMGLYNHFGGKLDVVDALVRLGHDRFAIALGQSVKGHGIKDRLTDAGQAYRRFAHANPRLYQLMFMQSVAGYIASPETAISMGRSIQVLVEHITAMQAQGFIRSGEPLEIAQQIWSNVHGYVSLELFTINFAPRPDEAYRKLLDDLLYGLGPR